MPISHQDLQRAFPFDAIRPVQDQALEKFSRTIESGKRFTVLEIPTGGGKSPIAAAMGLAAGDLPDEGDGGFRPGAHITTSQIILQKQYLRDFSEGPVNMAEIKGKGNYMCCSYPEDDPVDCATSQALRPKDEHCGASCRYTQARDKYLNSTVGVTNFAYFTTVRKAGGDHGLPKRQLLIVDEAHNTESELIGLGEIDISQSRLSLLNINRVLEFREDTPYLKRLDESKMWLEGIVLPQVKSKRVELLAQAHRAKDKISAVKLIKMAEGLDHFKSRVDMFLMSGNDSPWVVYNQKSPQGRAEGLVLKPLYAHDLAERFLFSAGKYVVLMSATILGPQVFTRNLGIPEDGYGFKRFDSDFPLENRPLFYDPVGSMAFKSIDKTLPKMAAEVVRIAKRNPDEKGMIHTNSYKVTKAIVEAMQDAGLGSRILTHTSDRGSRDKAVQAHTESTIPTIIVSPSLTEGLDLKDDLSRWQVLTKVPYPSLADPWIKARLENDQEWYALKTGLTLMQATGRSVRSKEDHAQTFILDSDFGRFMHMNDYLFPKWWRAAIQDYK